jgi:hypothetical protein
MCSGTGTGEEIKLSQGALGMPFYFAKLASTLVHSSLWQAEDHVRLLFVWLRVIEKKEGFVYISWVEVKPENEDPRCRIPNYLYHRSLPTENDRRAEVFGRA